MEIKAINRIAVFLRMIRANAELGYEVVPGKRAKVPPSTPVMSFMGSGASDIVTYENVVDMLNEVQILNEQEHGPDFCDGPASEGFVLDSPYNLAGPQTGRISASDEATSNTPKGGGLRDVQTEIHRRIKSMLTRRQQGNVMQEIREVLGAHARELSDDQRRAIQVSIRWAGTHEGGEEIAKSLKSLLSGVS